MRIGLGIDVHAFAPSEALRPLVIGGVHLKFDCGLAGHSDADVLTHAIMDALLSAARLGDIGQHFPPTDNAYKDADSIELLRQVKDMLTQEGWRVEDVDCVIIAEQPRLSSYRNEMRATIAKALGVQYAQVGVKATTSEQLGFVGRREGISAYAVALLERATRSEDV